MKKYIILSLFLICFLGCEVESDRNLFPHPHIISTENSYLCQNGCFHIAENIVTEETASCYSILDLEDRNKCLENLPFLYLETIILCLEENSCRKEEVLFFECYDILLQCDLIDNGCSQTILSCLDLV